MEKYRKLQYSDFDDFKNKNFNMGVLTLKLISWDEFHGVVKIFNYNPDYIWRGQRCYCRDWLLKSSFDRKNPKSSNRNNELEKIFKKFKQKLEDLPSSRNKSFTADEIWAIGQHYGLPTPLLDWTECPYIAAYMAFFKKVENGKNDQTENRVIYALNRVLKRMIMKTKHAKTKELLSRERFVEFDLDENNFNPEQNQRLKSQKGRFTKALEGDDIKATVTKFWKREQQYRDKIILAEILMTDKAREECLTYLEKNKKITHGTLFPDYAGAVEICKIQLYGEG
jgi:hypothetical protein